MNNKSWFGNGILFYFNDDGKLEIFIVRKKIACEKINTFVLFIECTELNWNIKDSNGSCVYIFFKYMRWYLGVIGKPNKDECLI